MKDPSSMTDSELIEALADFMGWKLVTRLSHSHVFSKHPTDWKRENVEDWNPLASFDDFRMVEEKMIEDANKRYDATWSRFLRYFALKTEPIETLANYMKAPLRTRCEAALSAVRSLSHS
ncbi:MAG: hypothetical protein PHH13_05705 [Candidatus Peribacteraceae bacterium]|nr:hypothetical protein [Candidatus Peribacteraceae bacterium]